MKVLVVGTSGDVVSGISTAADQTVRTLGRHGVEVYRVSAGSRRRKRPSSLNWQNVGAVVTDAWTVFTGARRCRADVVWYHTFGVPTLPALRALAIAVAARAAGAGVVVRLHPYGFEEWLDEGGRALRISLRWLNRVASALVVEFESAANVLQRRTGVRRVQVLPNWVEVPAEPAPLSPSPPFRLVFVGGLIVRKGIYELLDAVRLLDDVDVRLSLVGSAKEDGPSAQATLEESAVDLVAAGRVVMRGELPPDDVRHELRQAHAFILPTKAEGLPLAMLESMAEGRPVLVGEAGDIRRTVGEAGAGVVLPDTSPATVARELRVLFSDEYALLQMGALGHRYAARTHDEAVDQLLKIAGDVADRRRRNLAPTSR